MLKNYDSEKIIYIVITHYDYGNFNINDEIANLQKKGFDINSINRTGLSSPIHGKVATVVDIIATTKIKNIRNKFDFAYNEERETFYEILDSGFDYNTLKKYNVL